MSTNKTRFSASVKPSTLEVLDEVAEERDENRSATLDQVVQEWVQQQQEIESARQETGRLREQLDTERERAMQAEQERRELAEKEQADDSGGQLSTYRRVMWRALGLSAASLLAGVVVFFGLAAVLPFPSTWRFVGALLVGVAFVGAQAGFGLAVSELVVQIWHHDAELAEAVGEVVRGPFRRVD